jgi:mannitol-1-phosphate 5-dehydrogenase
MSLTGSRTFVGFGFGAIQAGLFLYEAFRSGNFGRLVVAEVVPSVVDAIRGDRGFYSLNIAHQEGLEFARIGPLEIYNPNLAEDLEHLIEAVAQADEIATGVPSIKYYVSTGPGSLHHILAEGLRRKAAREGPPAVVYTAENNNHAAEILAEQVFAEIPEQEWGYIQPYVRFLNTVIGKMSGVVTDMQEILDQHLQTVTIHEQRAFLVEAFNHILISQIDFPFVRGLNMFEEKANLLPFEEAKLYGHNATHALAAYMGAIRGVQHISDLREFPELMDFLYAAFTEESGRALIAKYQGFDPLFTLGGYDQYATDLLYRMTNPFLRDTVERVGRDPVRKLGWDDRLVGTMRLALHQGVYPWRFAVGAAAALTQLNPAVLEDETQIEMSLGDLWDFEAQDDEWDKVIALITEGRKRLLWWMASNFHEGLHA